MGVAGSVLETYREMTAFRRGSVDLMQGATRFFDLPEPILAFTRGDGLLCVFNLSPDPMTLSVQGVGGLTGPVHGATLTHERLALGPNGYAFLTATDRVNVIA
jgi:alpha-glucosidase